MVLCRGRAGLWPPAAHRSRDPAAHDNRGVITSKLLTRFSVALRLSALRIQHSRHVIIAALLTLSLPVSQQPLFRRHANSRHFCVYRERRMMQELIMSQMGEADKRVRTWLHLPFTLNNIDDHRQPSSVIVCSQGLTRMRIVS